MDTDTRSFLPNTHLPNNTPITDASAAPADYYLTPSFFALVLFGCYSGLSMETIVLRGHVIAGVGGGKSYLEMPGVKQQVEEKLGFKPYAGTLNIKLSNESALKRLELHQDNEDFIRPQVGVFPGILIKATIESYECAIVHPEDHNYHTDILEVIAPINLREKLGLVNGSEVAITVYVR
jgi:riboflavin kinase, archaea type